MANPLFSGYIGQNNFTVGSVQIQGAEKFNLWYKENIPVHAFRVG